MSVKKTGLLMAFMGVGALILPFFGLQFKILTLMGSFSWIIAIVLIITGMIIFFKGK